MFKPSQEKKNRKAKDVMKMVAEAGKTESLFTKEGHSASTKFACKHGNSIPNIKHGGSSIMMLACYAEGGTDAQHKINAFMRKDHFREILKQHLVQMDLPSRQ